MNHYPASQACIRVLAHPRLKLYYDIICEYDWPNIDDHIDWVCTAPIAEIEAWAQAIREDEKETA